MPKAKVISLERYNIEIYLFAIALQVILEVHIKCDNYYDHCR